VQVYGHVGECSGRLTGGGGVEPTLLSASDAGGGGGGVSAVGSSRGGSLSPREANTHLRSSKAVDGLAGRSSSSSSLQPVERVCVVSGDVVTTRDWYGFLRNLSLEAGGGYRFLFTYPSAMQVQSVDDQLTLRWMNE